MPNADLEALERQLGETLLRDRPRLQRRLRRLRRAPDPAALAALAGAVDASAARAGARRARLPRPDFPPGLPISAHLDAIATALASHQVVVVAGETGSGKTTQLPKLCLALGRGVLGQVGHTQPRRLAARSVATRIAAELDTPLGDLVGYRVRFQERGHPDALVRVMTDGILLGELRQDPRLLRYDTLIVDEAHERSLNIDFLLGVLRRLLPQRPELRVIVTSATIDTARFAAYFGDAPVIEVGGRGFPVEVHYRPHAGADDERDVTQAAAIVAAVDELAATDPDGDILVFLPGERDIREAAEALRKHHPPRVEILPLYARLSVAEQARVFEPAACRRIVLATNVAETSLTVPGIRHVVDTGLARISRFAPHGHVRRLPVEPVSRASADQRKGRCGRVAPGTCIRLYAEEDYLARPAFTDPEILRAPLAAVILQMVATGLGQVTRFPFLDPPDPRRVGDGYRQLRALGALDRDHRLTPLGVRLARLPVEPRLGRMVLAAAEDGGLREVLVIVAALAVQDPRERPREHAQAADGAHAGFTVEGSDFLGHLALWRAWQQHQRHLSHSKLRQWCRDHFLNYMRMREWQETWQQLDHLVRDMGLHPGEQGAADADTIHRALLAGLLDQVARREEKTRYRGLHGRELQLFPGSALAARPPPWLVAAELVETRRLYARVAAPVRPAWIEALAGDQLRVELFDPRWARRRGQVIAYERVTFHGLVLVARRRVNLGPRDPEAARAIFIRAALLDGELDSDAPFLRHNRALVSEIEALEARSRRRGLLVDEESLYRFYDARLPPGVHDRGSFEAWRRHAERAQPQQLFMPRELLLRESVDPGLDTRCPAVLRLPRLELPLRYRFAPEAADDGATLTLPLAALDQVEPARLEWLVPGLLEEKVLALLRALPKRLRRHCVPLPETARACLAELQPGARPLADQLAQALRRLRGVEVPPQALRAAPLPPHLRLHVCVVDDDGRELARGDDLDALRSTLGHAARDTAAGPFAEHAERPMRSWECGPLPEQLTLDQGGVGVSAWPALVPRGDGVVVTLCPDPDAARRQHRRGLRRLFLAQLGPEVRELKARLPGLGRLALAFVTVGDTAALVADLVAASVDRLFVDDTVRDAAAFAARLAAGRGRLLATAGELAREVGAILDAHRAARLALARLDPESPAARDVDAQLGALVHPGFVSATPARWLARLPVYLRAATRRLEGLDAAPGRDRERLARLEPWLARWRDEATAAAADPEAWTAYRWMLEEYRVSLFAQELGTALPVSPERLERQWARVCGETSGT